MANPVPQHNPTDGLGVAAKIVLSGGSGGSALSTLVAGREYAITLSKSAAGSFLTTVNLTAAAKDIGGNAYSLTSLTLTSVANASNGTTAYTGTITGGGSNALAGQYFTIAGFVTAANNGTFLCTASTTTVLTLANTAGASETHAATANLGNFSAVAQTGVPVGSPAWYRASNISGYNPSIATVAVSGTNNATVAITAANLGQCVVEVAFPLYDDPASAERIYVQVIVTVIP